MFQIFLQAREVASRRFQHEKSINYDIFFTLIHTGKLFKKMRISNNMTEEPLARETASESAPRLPRLVNLTPMNGISAFIESP